MELLRFREIVKKLRYISAFKLKVRTWETSSRAESCDFKLKNQYEKEYFIYDIWKFIYLATIYSSIFLEK